MVVSNRSLNQCNYSLQTKMLELRKIYIKLMIKKICKTIVCVINYVLIHIWNKVFSGSDILI